MDPLLQSVHRKLRDEGLPKEGPQIVAALSGGPDSTALLLALLELRDVLDLKVVGAHVNHQLRGLDSEEDEAFVRRLCHARGVSLRTARIDPAGELERSGGNLEECARKLRYQALFGIAGSQRALLATGHTLDDQAETLLLKLVRGAGPSGLSGIHPSRRNRLPMGLEVTVIRPLLDCSRREVLRFLEDRGQVFRLDRSNEEQDRDRNWLRHAILPRLSGRLNPSLKVALARSSALFREIADFLEKEAEKASHRCFSRDGEDGLLLVPDLTSRHPALGKEILRCALKEVRGGLSGISMVHLLAVYELAKGSSGREVHLPGGLRAIREFDKLRFTFRSEPKAFRRKMIVPGEIYVEEAGKRVVARLVGRDAGPHSGVLLRRRSGDREWTVRSRRPGDRYRIGSQGSKRKVKKLLQERKIPRLDRARLLFLEVDGRLAWIEGFPPAFGFQPVSDWTTAVEIVVRRETLQAGRILNE